MEDSSPSNRRERRQDLSLPFLPPQDFSCNFNHFQNVVNLNESNYVDQGSSRFQNPPDDPVRFWSPQRADFVRNHPHLGMSSLHPWMQLRRSTSFEFQPRRGDDHGELWEKPCRNYSPKEENYAGDDNVERRRIRMMKNRESAARSRARKQAYTTQLEQQVIQLRKSITWLKKLKEICRLLYSSPKASESRYQLRRTSSAKF